MKPKRLNRLRTEKQPVINMTKYEFKSVNTAYAIIGIISIIIVVIFIGGLIRDSKESILYKMSLTSEERVTLFDYQDTGITIGFVEENRQFADLLANQIELDLKIDVTTEYYDDNNTAQEDLSKGELDLVLGSYADVTKYAVHPNIDTVRYGGYSGSFLIFGHDFETVTPFNPINFLADDLDLSIGISTKVSTGTGIEDNIGKNVSVQFVDDETATTMLANGTLDLYISTATSVDLLVSNGCFTTMLSDSMYVKPTAIYSNSDKPGTGGIFEEYFSVDTLYNHIRDLKTADFYKRTKLIHENQLSYVDRELVVGVPNDNVSIKDGYIENLCSFLGATCRVVTGSPENLKNRLANGEIDAVYPLSVTDDPKFAESPVLFSTDMIAVVHTNYSGNKLSTLVISPQTTIGVVAGTHEHEYATSTYIANKIVTFDDSHSLLKAVDDGKVEVALTTLPRIAYYYDEVMFTSVIPTTITNISEQVDYVIKYRANDAEMEVIGDILLHAFNNLGGVKEIRNTVRLINSDQLLLNSKVFESKVLIAMLVGVIAFLFAGIFATKSLRERSLVDPLTQLKNRHGLHKRNQRLFSRNKNNLHDYVLCFIDVNNFKSVNDVLGHNEGDILLRKIGSTLLKYRDIEAFRIGGDEFAIIYRKRDAISIERIANDLNKKIEISGLNIGVSIGIVDLRNFGDIVDFDGALDFADYCMYIAKSSGSKNIIHADQHTYDEFLEFAAVDTSFAAHLDEGRIIPVFQPTVDLQIGKAVGFEVLGRKVGANGELTSIYKYINKFRSTNSFAKLDLFMFEEACKFLRTMKDQNHKLKRISVNFDPKSFIAVQPDTLVQIAKKYNLSTSEITLELTESTLVNDVTFEYVRSYKDKGFSLALDDFSAGHSSLQYIAKIDFDYVKIDKALVDDVESGISTKVEIFRSLLGLFRSLGKTLVIEGVENANQIDLLEDLNVHYVQGYYYSKPLIEKDAIEYFVNKNKS